MKHLYILICVITLSSCYNINKNKELLFDNIEKVDNILLQSQIVVNNDTLDIINTSWLDGTVTASNNITYDYKYIKHKFVNDTTLNLIEDILIQTDSIIAIE